MSWRDRAQTEEAPAQASSWRDRAMPEAEAEEEQADYGTLGNIAAGIMKGPSLGESIPLVGSAMKNIGQRVGAVTEGLFDDADYDTRLANIQARDEAERQAYEKQYPAAANIKNFAGAAMLPFGAAANAAVKGTGALYGLARGGINTLEAGAVSAADQALRGNLEQAVPAGVEASKWAAGGQAALGGIKGLGNMYSRFVAGLRPETIDRYMKRRPEINAIEEAPVVQEAAESIMGIKGRAGEMKEDVVNQYNIDRQSNRDLARLEVSRLRDQAKNKRSEISRDYDTRVMSETGAAQAAKDKALTDSMNRGKMNLDQASQLERQGAEDISEMMKTSGKKIGEASGQALRALDEYEKEIPLAWFKGQATKAIEKNRFGKALLPNEGVDQLVKYRALLDEAGTKTVKASEMKKLIQSLDADLADAYAKAQNGNYNTPAIKSLMGMRRLASARLKKEVPGYREAMEPVASMVGKQKALQRDLTSSDPDKIFSKVKGLEGPGKESFKQRLSAAEREFGGQGLSKLEQAQKLKQIDPTGGQTFDVPNQQFLDYLKYTKGKGLTEVEKRLTKSQANVEGARKLKEQAIVSQAKGKMKPVKELEGVTAGLTPRGVQQQLRNVGGNPPAYIKLREQLDKLGDKSGKAPGYYTQAADDLAVKRAFEGTFIRGSRNVNMAEKSFQGLAKALNFSSEGQGTMGSIGAILGGVSDVIGPKAVKVVIDMAESGTGKAARAALRRAALAGPQAIAQEHARLLRDDPEYRNAYESGE